MKQREYEKLQKLKIYFKKNKQTNKHFVCERNH